MDQSLVSICLPTRKRLHRLEPTINSVLETASKINEIELVIAFDDDDKETETYLNGRKNDFPNLKLLQRPRISPFNLSRDYYSYMARISLGRFCWGLGDDTIILTPGWDNILRDKIELGDKLMYISVGGEYINSNIDKPDSDSNFCCFPVHTRRHINTFQETCPAEMPGWGADRCMNLYYRVAQNWLTQNGYNINLFHSFINEIKVQHVSIHTGTSEMDNSYYHMESLDVYQNHQLMNQKISNFAQRIISESLNDKTRINCV